jgi:DNA-binding NtrC family response regulator
MVMSGDRNAERETAVTNVTPFRFLEKPFMADDLLEAVRSVLDENLGT